MAKRPERPKRSVRGRPRPGRDGHDDDDAWEANDDPRGGARSAEYGSPDRDEKTTWVPSSESMDPGELTSWISSKTDQPDFERTESRGVRRAPPTPDPRSFQNLDKYEGTGVVRTPRQRKRMDTPEPAPRRRRRELQSPREKRALPTPEPAPRRRTNRASPPTPAPAPKAPRPPTPEPAPPRRSRRVAQADEEPSLTVPRSPITGRTPMSNATPMPAPRRAPTPTPMPAPGRTPTPTPIRQGSVPRPAMPVPRPPPVPQPGVPMPDNWTPGPTDDRYGDPSTEIDDEHDLHGFPHTPDVPATVVSDDSIDEVPPAASLPHLPNDAPTVVRPDLANLDLSPPHAHADTVESPMAAQPLQYEQQPAGEPTVALPPPSMRKNTQVRQPTPEPAPDALPNGASYSPPTADQPNPGHQDRVARQQAREKRSGTPPPARSVKKPPPVGKGGAKPAKGSASAPPAPKRLPKNASMVGADDEGRKISPLFVVWGVVITLGTLLVIGAFVLGLVILVLNPA